MLIRDRTADGLVCAPVRSAGLHETIKVALLESVKLQPPIDEKVVACSSKLAAAVSRDNSSNADTFRAYTLKPALLKSVSIQLNSHASFDAHGRTDT